MDTSAPARPPLTTLKGDKVALGPVGTDLIPLIAKWRNDFEVTRTLGAGWRYTSWQATEAWFDRFIKDDRHASFTIYDAASVRPIGFTLLMDIDRYDCTAEFAIVIGEKEYWGKGYGSEATALTLDYGFNWLCLHNIRLRVYAHNERAAGTYERLGFKTIGRWREAHRLGNRPHDVILMDYLATEFQSPVLHQWLPDGSSGQSQVPTA